MTITNEQREEALKILEKLPYAAIDDGDRQTIRAALQTAPVVDVEALKTGNPKLPFDCDNLYTKGMIEGWDNCIDHLYEQGHLRTADDWRDIESAPKTSKSILVHCADRRNTYVVYWDKASGWVHFGGKCGSLSCEEPTHWRPLPQPPKGQDDEDL